MSGPLAEIFSYREQTSGDPSGPYGDEGWGRGRRPAINITWERANEYARWLSSRTGKQYRLLSEAEWEYAARAGASTAWPWGASEQGSCVHANLVDRTFSRELERALREDRKSADQCSDGVGGRTAPVGRYKANAFGLHDMIGNVAEWVADWSDNYSGAPQDGSARTDCNSPIGNNHVVRDGSLLEPASVATVTSRIPMSERTDVTGFRVASEDGGAIQTRVRLAPDDGSC